MNYLSDFFGISDETQTLAALAEADCREVFAEIERISAHNQHKVLAAFVHHQISDSHFAPTTGYGMGDRGREALDRVAAEIFGCEDALFRVGFASGTHALTVALFGLLRPGDVMLSVTGAPYDTLSGVIGIGGNRAAHGSLRDFGIGYEEIALLDDGSVDINQIPRRIAANDNIKMVYIQRSRGYTLRPALTVEKIGEIVAAAKSAGRDVVIMTDNCYGEFTQMAEPPSRGVDIIAGSLIKNPGGGIAPSGGYIAGRADLVERCAHRLTAPGVGREIGATLGHTRELMMGLYNAPHAVGEAMKSAVFCAALFERMGYDVSPKLADARGDIVQSVLLGSPEKLIAFCRGIQSGSAVDSAAAPEPDAMPGYDCEVIMASGSFTQGSSIELSADAPLRPPYAVWMQGGMHYQSAKVGIMLAAELVTF